MNILKFFYKNKFILIVFLDIAMVGFYVLFILNVYNNNGNTSRAIIDERKKQETILEKGAYLAFQNTIFDSIGDDRNIIDENFIPPGKALEFITTLEKMAEQRELKSTLRLDNINETSKEVQKIRLDISLIGDYATTLGYIRELERLPYYIQIYSAKIVPQNTKDSKSNKTEIKAYTYWY